MRLANADVTAVSPESDSGMAGRIVIRRRGTRWQAVIKAGRDHAASATFDTKREAQDWETRQLLALRGGADFRAGRTHLDVAMDAWLVERQPHVAPKTLKTDQSTRNRVPTWLLRREVAAVNEADIERLLGQWIIQSSHATVVRYRATLSQFFAWSVRNRMRLGNPVTAVRMPRPREAPAEMQPLSRADLSEMITDIATNNQRAAECALFLALTGVRWGEARALRVCDVHELPMPRLSVSRSQPESAGPPKSTKSGRTRFVPLTDEALAVVRRLSMGKSGQDLLLTTSGGAQLHRTAFIRTAGWETTGRGRRLHDLRHTAATLWLSEGVDLATVQQWLGHSSISVTQRYIHWLGTDSDRAAIDRLNRAGGDEGVTDSESQTTNS
jgi:integrase